MKLDHLLLALLTIKDWSGYELGKWLTSEGLVLRAGTDQSQIYRTLSRMQSRAEVVHKAQASKSGPDAKVYAITVKGRDALAEWAESPYEPPQVFQAVDFGAHFFAIGLVRPDRLLDLIDTELAARRAVHEAAHLHSTTLDNEGAALINHLHTYRFEAVGVWIEYLESLRATIATSLPG